MKMSIHLKMYIEEGVKLYGILDLLLNTFVKEKRGRGRGRINESACQNLNLKYMYSLYVSLSFCDYLKLFIITFFKLSQGIQSRKP